MVERSNRRLNAFTLLELLVVIGIIGTLAAILLPALAGAREQGRRTRCLSNLLQVGKALTLYANTTGEYLPSTPAWGRNSARIGFDGMYLTTYADHQGLSRHMVIGYGAEEETPAETLKLNRLNFAAVGLGILVARSEITTRALICPSMQGTAKTWFGTAQYEYTSAMPQLLGQSVEKPLMMSDGRSFSHVPTANGKAVTAILSSYSYRNMPFYSRLRPDNAPTGWSYTGDYPSLVNWSKAGQPWLAEWTLKASQGPEVKVQFMMPPFKTLRALGNRAIVSDSFDYARPEDGFGSGGGFARHHHKLGYNVLYGDGHVSWFNDDDGRISHWNEWGDPDNYGSDNLTISSFTSHKVWTLLDQEGAK